MGRGTGFMLLLVVLCLSSKGTLCQAVLHLQCKHIVCVISALQLSAALGGAPSARAEALFRPGGVIVLQGRMGGGFSRMVKLSSSHTLLRRTACPAR